MKLEFNEAGHDVLLAALSNYKVVISAELQSTKEYTQAYKLLEQTDEYLFCLITELNAESGQAPDKLRTERYEE